MKLLSLKLRNFKGIQDFTLDTRGGDIDLLGQNATGKTTIADAFMWVLFDKDSLNQKQFEIKSLMPSGEPIHGLEHEVEATLKLPNGEQTICKVYKEKWIKKHGASTAEFTGHTTKHYVNGTPVKKTEYEAHVAEIADEEIFRLLTDPMHFNTNIHWQDRRNLLLEVCGDINNEDVVAADKSLAPVLVSLAGQNIDDYRNSLQRTRREVNAELKLIPARIDEVTRNLPELLAGDWERELPGLQKQQEVKAQERIRIEFGGEVAKKQKRIAEINTLLLEVEQDTQAQLVAAINPLEDGLRNINNSISELKQRVLFYERTIDETRELESLEKRLQNSHAELASLKTETFEYEARGECPTCGQALPAEQVKAARQKALDAFNIEQTRKIDTVTQDVQQLTSKITMLRETILDAKNGKASAEKHIELHTAKVTNLQSQIKTLKNAYVLPPSYNKLVEERDRLVQEIANLHKDSEKVLTKLDNEINKLGQKVKLAQAQIAKLEQCRQGEARIKELHADKCILSDQYDQLEHELHLCDKFLRTKMSLLNVKINSYFKYTQFKLFRENINGSIELCCETMHGGVPYSSLNTGARVLVGLDIINTLASHYKFAPPVFADNSESVTEFPETKGQLIRLIHDPKMKKLNVVPTESFTLATAR